MSSLDLAVEARGLEKQFAGHVALNGIDFSVPRGSVYGFLGPNGAGKTTTIKIMLGLISATRGEIRVLGQTVRFGENGGHLAHTGYLPQDPVFPDGLSGTEVLRMVAEIYGLDRAEAGRRMAALLDDFQLSGDARRKVGVYSRGMKQRLGVAAALLVRPDLLVLDEPVSALDPGGRRTVLDIIRDLRGRTTVFFSSHILADVERVCDRVSIVAGGRKLMERDMDDLLSDYAMEQYEVRVRPDQAGHARALLEAHESMGQVAEHDGGLLLTSRPGRAQALSEEVIPMLIREGIRVTEFMRHRVDLEDVFFRVIEQSAGREVAT